MSAAGFSSFSAAPTPEELARYDLNDYGNALRLIRLSGGCVGEDGEVDSADSRLLYLLGSGWIGFNGRYWDRKFGEDLARRSAHQVAIKVRSLVNQFVADRAIPLKKAMDFADACGQAGASSAMLRQAQSYLTVEIDAFDRDPLALNVRNGTLKLRVKDGGFKVVLQEHRPGDRITRMAEVDYDPKATAPLFEHTVADSMPVAAERAYAQRILGYSATGHTREQAFFIFQGRGRDGKSTILDACRETMGSYAETGSILSFLDAGIRGGGDHSTDIAKLAGDTRMIILSEPPRGAKLNAGLLKAWTSGSPVTARELREKPFTFRPIGKLVIECNPLPDPKGDDDGIWRRIKPVLFRKQVPEDRVDKTLPEKLRVESSGILNWLLAGVEDWLVGAPQDGAGAGGPMGGLREPDSLRAVLDDYRKAASPISDWLGQRCVFGEAAGPGTRELSGVLYKDFKDWFEAQGFEKPMSARAFGDALRDRQVLLAGKDRNGLKYRGPIRLKTPEELEAEGLAGQAAADAMQDDALSNGAGVGDLEGSRPVPPIDEPGANDVPDEEWTGE